jgi:hypothetical protein
MKDNIFLLGVCGKARSGKDTAAAMMTGTLSHLLSNRVHRMSLAEPIKLMLQGLMSYSGIANPLDYLHGDEKETPLPQFGGVTARHLMQTLGTEWGRDDVTQNLWMQLLVARARTYWPETDFFTVVVIPDIRFDDEAKECDLVVEITRPGTDPVREHVSEKGITDNLKDFIIVNNKTTRDLHEALTEVINRVLEEEERYYGRADLWPGGPSGN